jgi:hypothetical protein
LNIDGLRIVINQFLPMTLPNKALPAKQWHGNRGTGRYAQRVNKKWRKRFGTKAVDMLVMANQGIVMLSPAAYVRLKKELK